MTPTRAATGPRTAAGKAVSARNATTHGLFCRQTVLPHLGEDPAGYQRLLDTLHEQLRPRNLMERQYLELWADASWKLRRLSRLEAQVWEDERTDEDARLHKLERLARLQTALRRQLDKALRVLAQDVPSLYAQRTREDVMEKLQVTETLCDENPYRKKDVERAMQANRTWPAPAEGADLDNTPDPQPATDITPVPAEHDAHKNFQNELPAPVTETPDDDPEDDADDDPEPEDDTDDEPEDDDPLPDDDPDDDSDEPETPAERRTRRGRELQDIEDRFNSGLLTPEERRAVLMDPTIPGYSYGGNQIKIHRR